MLAGDSRRSRWSVCGAIRVIGALILSLIILVWTASPASACPFCFGSLQLTLREQIETADATVIVRWARGEPGDLNRAIPASTTFEIVKVLQGDLAAGDALTIDRYQQGRAGGVFVMSGNVLDDVLRWDRSIPLTGEGLTYLRDLPDSSAPISDRLRYALRHLESPDDTVATDAFTVLASAGYEDIAPLKDELPREKLRRWVFGDMKIKGQLGVYGMLLGLCGDDSDRQRLEELILDTQGPGEYRLGIAGVMGGYLLLAGEDGLDVLDREFLANPVASASDRAAVFKALRFIGRYAADRIGKPRLCQSVRQTLPSTELPELAIADLARWEDWLVIEELLQWYEDPKRADKITRRAIIRFMIVASQADREGLSEEERAALDTATGFVQRLQKEQPALYKRAARALVPFSSLPIFGPRSVRSKCGC